MRVGVESPEAPDLFQDGRALGYHVAGQPAAYDGARASFAAPAVHVHGHGLIDGLINGVEDQPHLPVAGDAQVLDRLTLADYFDAPSGSQLTDRNVVGVERKATVINLVLLNEVDNVADTAIKKPAEPMGRGCGILVTGEITCKKFAWSDPI